MDSKIFGPSSRGRSERYVEYDWVLNHLVPGSVLDVGAMDTTGVVEWFWEAFGDREHYTLDIIPEIRGRKTSFVCDIREAKQLHDGGFMNVVCISTLEHIEEPERAVAEMVRIARGRVLITVPFGKAEKHSWGIQYDAEALLNLVSQYDRSIEFFMYEEPEGWKPGVNARGYGEGAPYASGVACVEIIK